MTDIIYLCINVIPENKLCVLINIWTPRNWKASNHSFIWIQNVKLIITIDIKTVFFKCLVTSIVKSKRICFVVFFFIIIWNMLLLSKILKSALNKIKKIYILLYLHTKSTSNFSILPLESHFLGKRILWRKRNLELLSHFSRVKATILF